jgi:protein TonB
MTDVSPARPFGIGQWMLALALALALHLLLAWALVGPEPRAGRAAGAAGAATRLIAVDAGATRPEPLAGAAESLPVLGDAAPTLLQPAPPPQARAMVDPAPPPVARSRARADDPGPRPRQRQSGRGVPESADQARTGKAVPRTLTRSGRSRADEAGAAKGAKASAGSSGSAANASRGIDRGAAPLAGNPHPRYPTLARSRGHEGRVLIRVSVLGNGRVGSARIASSSGHGILDRAALKAVKRWRFRPALRAGKPVAATVTVPVVFRLEG